MLKPNQTAKVKWCSKNKNRLVSLGYEFTRMGDEIEVNVEHLSYGSPSKIVYICDYCGAEIETTYMTYNKSHKYSDKDACKKCAHLKSQDAFVAKYGVTNPLQVPEINKKQRQTCLEKYGVEYALQNDELLAKKDNACIDKYGGSSVLLNKDIAEKKRQTCQEIYGCDIPSQNLNVQAKTKATNIERYGVEYASQATEVKEKSKRTFMEKYGVEYALQHAEFAHKAQASIRKTMYANGTVPTSKAQLKIFDMCNELYGEDKVVLNKPEGAFSLDVALDYQGQLVDIEYDGTYWHTDPQKDRRRDEVLKQQGYKILRIRGAKNAPTKEVLSKAIEELITSNHTFMSINIDI